MTESVRGESVREWLLRPQSYPHHPDRVDLVETHISQVFLAGDRVYKLKKPVHFDFLDFSTLARREQACREELRLNRRLADQVYLDVVPVMRDAEGNLAWTGAGETVDWLVVMRRLPLDRTLEQLCRDGRVTPDLIDRLVDLLVTFYSGLPPAAMSAGEYRRRFIAHVQGNRRELLALSHHLPAEAVKRIHSTQLQLLQLRPELFDARVAAGCVLEGHGDLRPEHICFTDPPVVFDCIEFSEEFRTLDQADELAFLAAECDFIHHGWIGERLFERFRARSTDAPPHVLVQFYKSYRACVRAKVAALRSDQLEGEERAAASAVAARYLELADGYLTADHRPVFCAVGGLSGTGKTTLALPLAEALGAELLRTDLVRQKLFGPNDGTNAPDAGRYRPEARAQTYAELFRRAAELLQQNIAVVLDATFATPESRLAVRQLADRFHISYLAVECDCSPATAVARIQQRMQNGDDASEADVTIYERQRQDRPPYPADIRHLHVNTELPLDRQLQEVLTNLAAS